MGKSIDFTVLVSVYFRDDPFLLDQALSSIFENSLPPNQVILICDGPLTSELNAIIDKYNIRENILVKRLQENKGLAAALNVGLDLVETEYVVRADADDFNFPYRFSLLINELDQGCDLVGSSILEATREGTELAIKMCPLDKDEIMRYSRRRNPFNHMTVGFRLDTIIALGGYPEIPYREDYALWANVLANGGRVKNLKEVTVRATTGGNFYIRRSGLKHIYYEYLLQRYFVLIGFKGFGPAIFHWLARSLLFSLPGPVLGRVYKTFLRGNHER